MDQYSVIKAWGAVSPGTKRPLSIEAMYETSDRRAKKKINKKSQVFRMGGVGPSGTSIVAKRCRLIVAEKERYIYSEILPRLSVPHARLFGSAPDEDPAFAWIFLEDVSGPSYDGSNPLHVRAVTKWIVDLHLESQRLGPPERLCVEDSNFYQSRLRECATLVETFRRATPTGDHALLDRIRAHLNAVDQRWDRISEICTLLPSGLSHSDLSPKNINVRRLERGVRVVPVDWEMSAWGFCAIDIGETLLSSPHELILKNYHELINQSMPNISRLQIDLYCRSGMLLRLISRIYWRSISLGLEPVERSLRSLAADEAQLAKIVPLVSR